MNPAMTGASSTLAQAPKAAPVVADPILDALIVIAEQLKGIRDDLRKIIHDEEGICVECGYLTEDRHDDEWLCDDCNAELVREQLEDQRLDDPRHGQADRERA